MEVGPKAKRITYATLDDKDPSPATIARDTFHLHQTKSQDAAKSRGYASNKVEQGVALSDFVAGVPRGEQIYHAGKVASLFR